MKKIISFVVVMLFSVATFAQVEPGHFYVQPQAGVTFARYSGDGLSTDNKTGFVGGADLGYQSSEKFAFSLGALYSMQGGTGAKDSQMPGVKFNFNYLNVPVLVHYTPIEYVTIKAGVQPGFLLSQSYDGHSLDEIKSFDFAIPVGVSLNYQKVSLDLRYNIGVTSIEEGTSMRNNVFMLTLGYKFQL